MLNSFWWGHSGNSTRGLHWLSWERLSVSRDQGGMGFKNLQAFNLAMLGKQTWTKPNSLITKSIWNSKFIVKDGCKWSIGTGEHIRVWEQNWLKEGINDRHGIAGNWKTIWRAKIPPEVKNLIWRIGPNILPTRLRLNSRGVQCPMNCAMCNDGAEE
ncbi:RNA-directed DNA polymerase (Reverse transcriptase) [Trifolium medium]|uniref:RNA-directed DNA polymerase (Reverse transcriptase) n=1 Tax=Trifolium medium TaxID=97028 RepID=A0A392MVX7_9FABA|nr:RNA-directed DNA polymerase (Reverse transcriptase) [Trifolium medium]